ncbi:MAG: type II secretion system F family protein [Candidatus Zapsychrus exili]|nr:type II secretion system F family protein [Candidatus Zapsychrus exili]
MPKFSYVVKDREGHTKKNVVEEISQSILVSKLQAQEYFIISVKEISMPIPLAKKRQQKKKKKQFSHKKVKLEDLLTFSRQLATMLESGVNLVRSLTVIQTQIQSEQLSKIIKQIRNDVEQGLSLSPALAKHPKVFNQFWVSLVEVGEASGTMSTVLNKLSFYLEQQASFRSTITSGIIYPLVLLAYQLVPLHFLLFLLAQDFNPSFSQWGQNYLL